MKKKKKSIHRSIFFFNFLNKNFVKIFNFLYRPNQTMYARKKVYTISFFFFFLILMKSLYRVFQNMVIFWIYTNKY